MDEDDDLQWHALNYRTAGTLQAEEMWQALSACVARMVAAERERCAKLCEEHAGMRGTGAWAALTAAADRIRDPERAKRDSAPDRAAIRGN